MITSTERHKLVSSRDRGQRVLTADIDFRVVEECYAVITAPFLVEAAKAEDLSKCNKTDDAAIIHCSICLCQHSRYRYLKAIDGHH